MYELIPEELKKLNNWICWKAVPDAKSHSGIKKVPISPKTGYYASANKPETWSDFETAERVSRSFAGIGFVFTNTDYFGIDIDDRQEELQAFLNHEYDENNIFYKFIDTMKSYAELSQSKNGIHIICKGKLPDKDFKNKPVEMYAGVRYFCMTGNFCGSYADISDGTESVKPLYYEYCTENNDSKISENQLTLPVSFGLSAQEIISKIRESKQGAKFSSLYDCGDISNYNNDDSNADMALCSILAFWCNGDISLMDEIFRSSALMRPKWDKKNAGSTYGGRTMRKAVANCSEFYTPSETSGIITDHSLKIKKKSSQKSETSEKSIISAKSNISSKKYQFDDTGNAERLFDMFGEDFRYNYTENKYLYYESGKWHFDNFGYERRIADAVVSAMEKEINLYSEDEKIKKAFLKHCSKSRSFTVKTHMLREAQHLNPILIEQLDRSKTIIGVKNGIIDLKTAKLLPHDRNAFLTKQVNLNYHANAEPPVLWLKFLDEIFQGDKELIRYVQKALGYSLTGSTQEQCAFFLYGTGRNGKSTFLEIVRNILGDYANNIQPETIMINQKSGNAPSSDIARLKGSRFVTSVEPNEGMKLNEGLLKQMTGGDIMTVRKLYCTEFEFRPEFKIWMATNHKPIIRGTDTGVWRRVHMIPFMACIPENQVDRHLLYKLAKESEKIFKWMVDGCLLWQQEGLDMPNAVYQAVKEYRQEMDVISNFLDACCLDAKSGEVRASELYNTYVQWTSENGEYRMSNTKFGMEMTKKFQKVKKKTGWYYIGLKINDEFQKLVIKN